MDPQYNGPPTTAQVFLALAVIAAGCYLYWRLAGWLINKLRGRVNWRRLQYWWPTAMLASIGLLILAEPWARGEIAEDALAVLCVAWILLNIPVAPVLLLIATLTDGTGWTGWNAALPAAALFWAGWHWIIRLAQWCVRETAAASLSIR